jgi:AraC-like DNA-binding protein
MDMDIHTALVKNCKFKSQKKFNRQLKREVEHPPYQNK